MSGERFATQTLEEMTPEQRKAAEAILAGPRGGMRGPFKALLRSPDLADKVQRVGEYVRFRSCLHPRLNELGILLVGRYWTAQYEFYAHRILAEKAGLSPAICDAIAEGRRPDAMDEEERVVWEFGNELLQTKEVSDATFAAVKEKFGEQGVIDLVGGMGYYTVVSMVLNVDRVPLPPDAVPLKKLA
jgi:4-carboxymuconolactone decarboxylase